MKSLIILKIVGATLGIGGAIAPITHPLATCLLACDSQLSPGFCNVA